jgi:methionyl-tRNA formyltransferase
MREDARPYVSDRFRVIFLGSPAFAVPSLEAACAIADVVGVVCQPDRPAGRGLAVRPPAVKVAAASLGLPVVQPTKLRSGDFEDWARAQAADVALVVAYGRILPKGILEAPRLGCVNVHASLLPKYRGAAPVGWAIVRGETETGVTLMKLDEGMDTGPMFARVVTPIGPDETAGELTGRLAQVGAEAVREWLPKYVAGACILVAQDNAAASLAPVLAKEDGRITWDQGAQQVHDHVRGMNPWPGAFTSARGRVVKVQATHVVIGKGPEATAGQVLVADKTGVVVACGRDSIELVTVQPEGRRPMRASEWAMGRGTAKGDVLLSR